VLLVVLAGIQRWKERDRPSDRPKQDSAVVKPATVDSGTVLIDPGLPKDAVVTIDGQALAADSAHVVPGKHVFAIDARGFRRFSQELDIGAGEVTTWSPRIQRIPPPVRREIKSAAPQPSHHIAEKVVPRPDPKQPNSAALFNASQDWPQAFRVCLDESNAGVVHAQQILGLLYEKGLGTPADPSAAAQWYFKAAQAGNSKAQNYYGRLLLEGRGVKRDREGAISWLNKSAEQGDVEAMTRLGQAYLEGEGVKRDKTTAANWFRKAADLGYGQAEYVLSRLYDKGDGVPKSDSLALALMERAANHGYLQAKEELPRLQAEYAKHHRNP